jgi:Lsr2
VTQRIKTLFVDDFDGSEAASTVRFALDGTEYEIDLNAEHAQALRDALARYVQAARRATSASGMHFARAVGREGVVVGVNLGGPEHVRIVFGAVDGIQEGGFPTMARALLFDVPEDAGPQKRFWTLKLAEATVYWTEGHDSGLMPDAQFDAIMTELSKIKQMIRQLQHS